MKKLLSVLAAVGLTATASSAVVACGSSEKSETVDVKDGAINMTVKNTKDLTWGEDGKVEITKDGQKVTVSSITQLFKTSKDGMIVAIANHVKDELGIKDLSKEPMITTYFGTTKPSLKDGSEYTDAEINKDSNTDANKASFDADAKDGKTLYIVLRSKAEADKQFTNGTANDTKVKVAVLKLTFTKISEAK